MQNPVEASINTSDQGKTYTSKQKPRYCRFPIMGLPFRVVEHQSCQMCTQEIECFENHLQLVEIQVHSEIELKLSTHKAHIFLVIMIEGFFRYYNQNTISFYNLPKAMYMAYCPRTQLFLRVGQGKHSILVISINSDWILDIGQKKQKLAPMIEHLLQERQETMVLPMCRITKSIQELLENVRLSNCDTLKRKAQIVVMLAEMVNNYHELLEKDAVIKSQLSAHMANLIHSYVTQNLIKGNEITAQKIADHIGISIWKVREYAHLIFGQSLHKHILNLRIMNASQLLTSTNLSVSGIGLMVGFASDSHFYKIFKKFFKLSPQNFRDRHQKTTGL